LNFV